MSVLQVYMNWVNSVLSDVRPKSEGEANVGTLQEGQVLCQLIDTLCPEACLQHKVQSSGSPTSHAYIRAALDHIRNHGIRFQFTPQDILDGDIKSILDVLWLIILNYCIHLVDGDVYQRSVGVGKKILLDWCQRELNTNFDPQNSLAFSLSTGDCLVRLLEKQAGVIVKGNDKEEQLKYLLETVENRFGIKKDIINASDVCDGTIDEHTLMIYVSLLRRKVGDTFAESPVASLESSKRKHIKDPSGGGSRGESPQRNSEIPSITVSQLKPSHIPKPVSQVTGSPCSSQEESPQSSREAWRITRSVSEEKPGLKSSDESRRVRSASQEKKSGIPVRKTSTSDSPEFKSFPTPKKVDEKADQNATEKLSLKAKERPGTWRVDDVVYLSSKGDSIDQDTSDWTSGSSGLSLQSSNDKEKFISPEDHQIHPEAQSLIMDTISQDVSEHFPRYESPEATEGFTDRSESPRGAKHIMNKVKRPRSPQSIMAEARKKQELEKEKKAQWRSGSQERVGPMEIDEPVLTGSASEGDREWSEAEARVHHIGSDNDPMKSDDEDIAKEIQQQSQPRVAVPQQLRQSLARFEVPGQSQDVTMLLDALRSARTEANFQDRKMNGDLIGPHQAIDVCVPQLKSSRQSGNLYDPPRSIEETSLKIPSSVIDQTPSRGRTISRELRMGERKSPPRGILDVVANQESDPDETRLKERRDSPLARNRMPHTGILRKRLDNSSLAEVDRQYSLDYLSGSHNATSQELETSQTEDPDKRLIRYLTNEIENLKLKIEVMERKKSPVHMAPRVTEDFSSRDRSPSQVSSRAKARYSTLNSNVENGYTHYSPTRSRASETLGRAWSVSPRSSSRSPSRSPSVYRSRISPDRLSRSGSTSLSPVRRSVSPSNRDVRSSESPSNRRSLSPSGHVMSLQDLSTSVTEEPDGTLSFSPANNPRQINLGYSSPVRHVTQEIWGNTIKDEDYNVDIVKYTKWKSLIALDDLTDDDILELKQALASALVELDILQAKLNNTSKDIKEKMGKTTEVLNDCRAHLTKSQAENMELRSQIEREKAKAEAMELRLKEMEENLHNSKSNQDDLTQELEETVITLKGIVGQDKQSISSLDKENEKLREKLSHLQTENIKLKEDFNELKMYNDKAQITVKDLRTCLEDARKERTQLYQEIKKIQTQGKNSQISGIVNRYIEKGLYDEAEQEHIKERARLRSPSPKRYMERTEDDFKVPEIKPRSRSAESRPVITGENTFRTSGPVKRSKSPLSFNMSSGTPRAISPVRNSLPSSFNYEEISPSHKEIYPHRRTKSYMDNFGRISGIDQNDSQVDLDDPELVELLNPNSVGKLDFDMDLSESYGERKVRSKSPYESRYGENVPQKFSERESRCSLYGEKELTSVIKRSNHINGEIVGDEFSDNELVESIVESPPKSPYTKFPDTYMGNRKFIEALDNAVMANPQMQVQKQYFDDFDLDERNKLHKNKYDKLSQTYGPEKTDMARGRIPNRSILKNAKSLQNLSIKESLSPSRAPASTTRSISPKFQSTPTRSYSAGSSQAEKSYFSATRTDTSPAFRHSHSISSGTRTLSPLSKSRDSTLRTSGYSTGTSSSTSSSPQRSKSPGRTSVTNRNFSSNQPTTQLRSKQEHKSLLSEEERRYADLLIDKYTRKHIIDAALVNS
ncbi:hypothetical protein CHS0354_034305 [Potamilus streckersoni]|uniref:Calponin-homology (CH) domain-containing protein n=1 Tax=Potamilus streckersoni TaxID=2493646 RepID=A0AAE0TB74_9BIVA|nr:hypothetical protein CHS0354_034305 [Potamilus streckersoni]